MATIAERVGVHGKVSAAHAKFAELIYESLNSAIEEMAVHVESAWRTPGQLSVAQTYAMSQMYQLCYRLNTNLDEYSAYYPGLRELVNELSEDIDEMGSRFNQRIETEVSVISTNEAMERFSRSRSTIYRWIKNGKLKAEKQGRQWAIFI